MESVCDVEKEQTIIVMNTLRNFAKSVVARIFAK